MSNSKFDEIYLRIYAQECPLLEDNAKLEIYIYSGDHYPSADPEGGQAVRTPPPPWKIISYMGFSRVGHCSSSSISPTPLVLRSLMQVQRAAVLCTNVLWDQFLPRLQGYFWPTLVHEVGGNVGVDIPTLDQH